MPSLTLPEGRPALMGIINATPDSFSDGGKYASHAEAIEAGLQMIADGADLVDVGGESTRPGSDPVSVEDELDRVLPIVAALSKHGVPVSIDTTKTEVGLASVGAGAVVINDVSALQEPGLMEVAAKSGCFVCLMHMQGTPRSMQANPAYQDVVAEVRQFLLDRAEAASRAGIEKDRIWIDPGIGFGKTVEHNLELIRRLEAFVDTPYPVLLGASRKSFIGKVLGGEAPLPVDERLEGTLAVQASAQLKGARIIRAHDVRASRRVIDMIAAIES